MVSYVPFLPDDYSVKWHGVKSFSPSDTNTQIFKCAFVIESWGIGTPSKTTEKEQSHDRNMNYTVQKLWNTKSKENAWLFLSLYLNFWLQVKNGLLFFLLLIYRQGNISWFFDWCFLFRDSSFIILPSPYHLGWYSEKCKFGFYWGLANFNVIWFSCFSEQGYEKVHYWGVFLRHAKIWLSLLGKVIASPSLPPSPKLGQGIEIW